MVYSIALSYLQHKEDAEEVTQDVFVKVYQKLNKFREEASSKTWIYKIAVNQSLDYIKAKSRNKRSLLSKAEDISKVSKTTGETPAQLLEQKERIAVLMECIDALPDQQKTAFLLSKIEGLKQEEVAKIMDKSIPGIESLVFRAKQNLKKIIASKWKRPQE